jgi:hypothetical protein
LRTTIRLGKHARLRHSPTSRSAAAFAIPANQRLAPEAADDPADDPAPADRDPMQADDIADLLERQRHPGNRGMCRLEDAQPIIDVDRQGREALRAAAPSGR